MKAVVADVQLKSLDSITRIRIKNAAIYDRHLSELKGLVTIPERKPGIKQVFHTYVISIEDRKKLKDFLADNGIDTKIHYPIPIHLLKASKTLGYKKNDFPVTERLSQKILSLPVHHFLETKHIYYVIDTIFRFYGRRRNLSKQQA